MKCFVFEFFPALFLKTKKLLLPRRRELKLIAKREHEILFNRVQEHIWSSLLERQNVLM